MCLPKPMTEMPAPLKDRGPKIEAGECKQPEHLRLGADPEYLRARPFGWHKYAASFHGAANDDTRCTTVQSDISVCALDCSDSPAQAGPPVGSSSAATDYVDQYSPIEVSRNEARMSFRMRSIHLAATASTPDFEWAETGNLKTRPPNSRLGGNDQGSKPVAFTNEAGM